jgi:hypothetical protein
MLGQQLNNMVISMGAFSLTGKDGIIVTPYEHDYELFDEEGNPLEEPKIAEWLVYSG